MSKLLLIVAFAAAGPALADDSGSDRVACSVSVRAFDPQGRTRPVQGVSATRAAAVVFHGRVSPREDDAPTLLFDVFTPRGRRYQSLVATPRIVTRERDGHRIEKQTRTQEAALAVAGSSIAWTSMYGKWRVEPRIEGADRPCGRAEFFTIRP
jgi:hypothetical protein